jgi:hypothetical protein
MKIARSAEFRTDLAPEALYRAIVQVRRWPEWDHALAAIDCGVAEATLGTRFRLTPRGGPSVAMLVEAAQPPHLFSDAALLPLARMRTRHLFSRQPDGSTLIRVELETSGLLALLWDRLIARRQIEGAAAQAQALADFARAQA